MRAKVQILLAEDDEGHYILARNYLRKMGICNNITWLKNGQEVLDFINTQDDKNASVTYFLMLDIRMPKISGIEVLEEINKQNKQEIIHTAILTTSNNPEEIEKCQSLGCNSYIIKPLTYEKYLNAVIKSGLYPSNVHGGIELILKP